MNSNDRITVRSLSEKSSNLAGLATISLLSLVKDEKRLDTIEQMTAELSRESVNGSAEATDAIIKGLNALEKADPNNALKVAVDAIEVSPAGGPLEKALLEKWQDIVDKHWRDQNETIKAGPDQHEAVAPERLKAVFALRALVENTILFKQLVKSFNETTKPELRMASAEEAVKASSRIRLDTPERLENLVTTLRSVHDFATSENNSTLAEEVKIRLDHIEQMTQVLAPNR